MHGSNTCAYAVAVPDSRGVGTVGTDVRGCCSEGVESGGCVGGASWRDQGGWIEEGGDFISVFGSTEKTGGKGGREGGEEGKQE